MFSSLANVHIVLVTMAVRPIPEIQRGPLLVVRGLNIRDCYLQILVLLYPLLQQLLSLAHLHLLVLHLPLLFFKLQNETLLYLFLFSLVLVRQLAQQVVQLLVGMFFFVELCLQPMLFVLTRTLNKGYQRSDFFLLCLKLIEDLLI